MRRISYAPYILFTAALFGAMSLPTSLIQKMRFTAVGSISGLWNGLHHSKLWIKHIFHPPLERSESELHLLEAENQLLVTQVDHVRAWLNDAKRIDEECQRLQYIKQTEQSSDFFQRRAQELSKQLEMQLKAVPAKVIFRDPSSWSSSLWINVGEKFNRTLNKKVIFPNSPVVVGKSIVGVVETVGEERSLVRLISDAHLVPSVRAVRGVEQNLYLYDHIQALSQSVDLRRDLFSSEEEAKELRSLLHRLKDKLMQSTGDGYLAKGEIHGSSEPLWRSRTAMLKGIGFNYDFADQEGPARDLRSSPPLLREGDLLITTGLDGIFPAGFRVGVVARISNLREGACSYDIEAISTAGDLSELTHVIVLPALVQEGM